MRVSRNGRGEWAYGGYDDQDGECVAPNENVIRMLSPEGGREDVEDVHCDEHGHSPSVLGGHDVLRKRSIRSPPVHCREQVNEGGDAELGVGTHDRIRRGGCCPGSPASLRNDGYS